MRGSLIFTSVAYAKQEMVVIMIIYTKYQISSHVSKRRLFTVIMKLNIATVICIHSSEEEEEEDPKNVFRVHASKWQSHSSTC